MKIIKKSQRQAPRISLILLDWGVRESFHLLDYLSQQTIDRDLFEVVIIEYYSGVSKAVEKFADEVDSWILLEMPDDAYYHKHLMYNAGIIMSKGEYSIICDSDAMAKPTFLKSVLDEFEKDPDIVLHIDQFRNNRKDFYPFNYPTFEEVTGKGCINYQDGKTTGMSVTEDVIHNRNYGACFCARRDLLIEIGGADEHIDFIGHICGPYDLTFRLINAGCKEIWHESEFLYHTWHPGQAGENNYLGPHDGRHISSTSLEALYNMRIQPHVENPLIAKLRNGHEITESDLESELILPEYAKITDFAFLSSPECRAWADNTYKYVVYSAYNIIHKENKFYAVSRFVSFEDYSVATLTKKASFISESFTQLKAKIDAYQEKNKLQITYNFTLTYVMASRIKNIIKRRLSKNIHWLKRKLETIIIKPIKNLYQLFNKITNKYQGTKVEHKYYWQNMSSLTHNIRLASKESKSVSLIISSGNESAFIFIARKLRLLPKDINILKSNNVNDITQFIKNEPASPSQVILLSRQLYIDNALYFEGIPNGKRLYVV